MKTSKNIEILLFKCIDEFLKGIILAKLIDHSAINLFLTVNYCKDIIAEYYSYLNASIGSRFAAL
jgi:hypothetical protein